MPMPMPMPVTDGGPSDGGPSDRVLHLTVRSRRAVSATVAELVLGDARGYRLPSWQPGAHLAIHVPGVGDRQFSLCGDPAMSTAYRIAVLRETDGRGGSTWLHDHVRPGDAIDAAPPINHFQVSAAGSYRLIAGGVGIAPLLPMARELAARGADWRLAYLGRSRRTMAYLDELAGYGDRVAVHVSEERGRADLAVLTGSRSHGTALYACGPEALLQAIEKLTADWPAGAVHFERFTPLDPLVLAEAGAAFQVELARSGLVLVVPPGQSILAAVEAAGIRAEYSCREGTCGTCETAILAGHADHRDSILSPDEQAADEVMMICVSRSKSPRLVLDL